MKSSLKDVEEALVKVVRNWESSLEEDDSNYVKNIY